MSLGAACGFVEVGEDLVDHHRIFDAGDDVHGRTNVAGGRMPGATDLT